MKNIVKLLLLIVISLPVIIFADNDFSSAKDIANNYIYSLPEYSRYLKTNGEQPFGFDGTKVTQVTGFNTGGFLNVEEFRRSRVNNASYLAPGIQYWLIDGQTLDLDTKSGATTSGVRVTEYVLHGTKVKGAGTQTTPWEFVDGYTVKIGTTDRTRGTIDKSYEHVQINASAKYDFTLTLNGKYDVNIDECLKNKNGKFEKVSQTGNEIQYKVTKVIGDFICNIDLGAGCNHVVFNDDNATIKGMEEETVYYKYGSGWFNDEKCLTPLTNVKLPKKSGNVFTGYKLSDDTVVINDNKIIKLGIDSTKLTNGVVVNANYRPTKAIIYFSAINQNDPLVSIEASNTVPSDYVYLDGTPATDIRGKTHNYKLANGDIYINGVKTTFKNLVYYKESTETDYKLHHNTIKKYGNELSNYGGGINNYNNSHGMNISKAGYIAQPGQEWKCASGNCTHTVYNQGLTSYTSDDFCSSQYSDCNVVLEVNWVPATTSVTILAYPNSTVKIDGTIYNVDSDGKVETTLSYGNHVIEDGHVTNVKNYNVSDTNNTFVLGYFTKIYNSTSFSYDNSKNGVGKTLHETRNSSEMIILDGNYSKVELDIYNSFSQYIYGQCFYNDPCDKAAPSVDNYYSITATGDYGNITSFNTDHATLSSTNSARFMYNRSGKGLQNCRKGNKSQIKTIDLSSTGGTIRFSATSTTSQGSEKYHDPWKGRYRVMPYLTLKGYFY